MEVEGHFSHDVIDAAGQKVDDLSSIQRVLELSPGIYSVKFGNGSWTGIEVKAGETTEIKPGYLEVNPSGGEFAYVLEPETGEVVEGMTLRQATCHVDPGPVRREVRQPAVAGRRRVERRRDDDDKAGRAQGQI